MATITAVAAAMGRQQWSPPLPDDPTPQQLREWAATLGASESSAALGASESATVLGASESAAAPGASESAAALGASESATALGACASPAIGPSSAEALHTFKLDSGASRCFFRDCTTLTPLAAPVPVSLADPTGGPVVTRASTVLSCPAVPSGSLSGLHLPTFLMNLVSNTAIQDVWVDTFIPGGQRVAICTCSRSGRHLATFTRRPGSSLYTVTTASARVAEAGQVAASSQLSASSQLAASYSCRVLPTDAPPLQFYHPCLRRVFSSQDVTFDESVCYYRLHPHASHPVPLAPIFLVPVPPPVDPLPLQGPAPSGVSQVDPPPLVEPLEPAAKDFGAETAGAELGGAETEGEGSRGAGSGGATTGGAGSGGAATRGAGSGGAATGVAGSWGAVTGGADSGGPASPTGGGAVGDPAGGYGPAGAGAASPEGAAGAGGAGATSPRGTTCAGGDGPTSPGGTAGAAGAGGAAGARGTGAGGTGGAGAAGLGGAHTGGARAARAGGAVCAGGATRAASNGGTGGTAGAGGAGAAEAGGSTGTGGAGGATGAAGGTSGAGGAGARGATGATGTGGAGGTTGARGTGATGASGAAGAGGAAGGAGAGGAGAARAASAKGSGAAGTALRRPFFYPQPQSSLPPPDSVLCQVLSLPSSTSLPLPLLCPLSDQSQPKLLHCGNEVVRGLDSCRRTPTPASASPTC
ncbi:unnamed protein product [Closterium sp. NIES-53]